MPSFTGLELVFVQYGNSASLRYTKNLPTPIIQAYRTTLKVLLRQLDISEDDGNVSEESFAPKDRHFDLIQSYFPTLPEYGVLVD